MTKSKSETKTSSSLFRIHVRPDAQQSMIKIGKVREDSFVGEVFDAFATPPIQYVPNHYRALGVKKMKDGKYNGEFEFAKSVSEAGAVMIDVRYLASCHSLDAKWQDENGFEPNGDEEAVGWAWRQGSIVEFQNSKVSPLWAKFLQHHQGNGGNQMRDYNNSVLFTILDDEALMSKEDELLEQESLIFEIRKKIKEGNEDYLNAYCDLVGIRISYSAKIKQGELMKFIRENSEKFYKMYIDSKNEYLDIANQMQERGYIIESGEKGKFFVNEEAVEHEEVDSKQGMAELLLTSLSEREKHLEGFKKHKLKN